MERKEEEAKHHAWRAGNKLGTFGGGFTPSILTILGVIMNYGFNLPCWGRLSGT